MFHSAAAVQALVDGARFHADVIVTPLRSTVARLDLDGARPVLWLDKHSPTEDQCWALLDALRVLARGPSAALAARPVRRLYSVS